VVHTPSAGLLRVSEVLQQLGNPLRGLGRWWRAWGRLEALWRENWLYLWITAVLGKGCSAAGSGVEGTGRRLEVPVGRGGVL
jgi:hypothetical protein